MLKANLGIAPIAWWNDDLVQLSDDVALEECLRQGREAGYSGMETGRRFPLNAAELLPILQKFEIQVCGGWYSGNLLIADISEEKDNILPQLECFKACNAPCIVYGEVANSIQGNQNINLNSKITLDESQIKTYAHKMTEFAIWCAEQGMPLSYHHHMGAAIQSEPEIDGLMNHSGSELKLLLDTGHLFFAGGDVASVISKYAQRINHVHYKDIRKDILDNLNWQNDSFLDAVLKGVFTVPGDGSLDFASYSKMLAEEGYQGWFVVEAEQDPKISPPLEMAKIGYNELSRVLNLSGYEVQ